MKMLSVIIPAYNEEKGISKVIEQLKTVLERTKQPYEIVVIDDGSTDNTAKIVDKIGNIKVVRHAQNKGYGAALKTGIKSATGDLILITDADGSYPSKDVPRLLEHVGQYDMVVGARTGKDVKIQLYRRPAKWFLSRLANYLSGTKIPDLNSGMRLFRKETAVKFFNILPSGFSFTTTITLAYLSNDYNIKYVPISYPKRTGKSKIKPLSDGFNFIMLIVRTITYFNPLKVFLPISIILLVIGTVVLLYQGIVNRNIAELSVMLILSAFMIGFLGLLADLIARKG